MFPLLLVQKGYACSAACECDAEKQTVYHVVLQCPIHRPPHGLHGLAVLDDENRMAVQHLPRDLVRPSSGYEELAQKKHGMKFPLSVLWEHSCFLTCTYVGLHSESFLHV